MAAEIVIAHGRVLDPASGTDGIRHVVVRDGQIAELSEKPLDAARLARAEVLDATGCWVLPGLIDLHVHLREPGEEYKETIASGTAAAVAGGFTAVACMPNTRPVNDCAAITELILRKAREAALARVYPVGAVSKGEKGEELAEMGELIDAGCRAVSDDGNPIMNPKLMRRALEYVQAFDVPVMVHEQDALLAGKGVMHEGPVSTRLGLRGIPAAAEVAMVARDLELLQLTGGKLHIQHVSCAATVELLRQAKRRGLRVTAEVTPHHLTLTDEAVAGYDTNTKVNPPLRSERDREALVAGLADGTLDAIATDHAPHSSIEKDLEYDKAANGLIGLETAVPLALELVRGGALTPLQLAERMALAPARILGVPGGRLAAGEVADVTVVDPEAAWTCDPARLRSKSRNTPFAGRSMMGRARATLVGGRIVYRSDA